MEIKVTLTRDDLAEAVELLLLGRGIEIENMSLTVRTTYGEVIAELGDIEPEPEEPATPVPEATTDGP